MTKEAGQELSSLREQIIYEKLMGLIPIHPEKRRIKPTQTTLAEDLAALGMAGQVQGIGQQRMFNQLLVAYLRREHEESAERQAKSEVTI